MILLLLLFFLSAWNLSGGWRSGKEPPFLFHSLLNILKWKKSLYLQVNKKKLFKNFKQFQDVLLLMPATQRWVFKWKIHLLTFLTLGLKKKLSQNQNTCEATHFSGSQTFLIPLHLPQLLGGNQPLVSLALPHQCVKQGHWAQGEACTGAGVGISNAAQVFVGFAALRSMVSVVKTCSQSCSIAYSWYYLGQVTEPGFLLCEMRRQVIPAPYALMWELHKRCNSTWNHTQYLVIPIMEKNLYLKLIQLYCNCIVNQLQLKKELHERMCLQTPTSLILMDHLNETCALDIWPYIRGILMPLAITVYGAFSKR